MNGIRSVSRSFSNAANAGDCLRDRVARAVTSFDARPLGRTTIIGTAFLSAYRLSRITLADAAPRPLVLVAADAVEEVEDRIFLVLGVARRRVDLRLALHADRRRVVLDRLQLAAVDAVALGVKALGGRGEVLSLRLACPPCPGRAGRRSSTPARRHRLSSNSACRMKFLSSTRSGTWFSLVAPLADVGLACFRLGGLSIAMLSIRRRRQTTSNRASSAEKPDSICTRIGSLVFHNRSNNAPSLGRQGDHAVPGCRRDARSRATRPRPSRSTSMARIVLGSEEARRASSCCVIASCSARHASKTNWSAVTPGLEKWASETRCIAKYAARRSRGSSRLLSICGPNKGNKSIMAERKESLSSRRPFLHPGLPLRVLCAENNMYTH